MPRPPTAAEPARTARALSPFDAVLIAALVAGVIVAGYRIARLWTFTIDDAFITARYARNVALGYGPVYNRGETPVEGTSNLLYVLLLSLAELSGRIDIITFGKLIGVASGAGVLYVSYRCVRALGEDAILATLPATLLLVNGSFALWTVGGLETNVYALLLLLAVFFLLLADERPHAALLAGFFGGLAALTRFDGLFLGGALLAAAALRPRRRRAPLVALAVFALIAAPGMLWKRAYYGTFLPNCGFAKTVFDPDLTAPFGFLRRVLLESPERYTLVGFFYANEALVVVALVYGVWCLVGRPRDEKGASFCVVAGGVAVLGAVGFLNVQTWMPGFRYHLPFLPLLAVAAAIGCARLARIARALPGGATTTVVALLVLVAWPQIAVTQVLVGYADWYRAWVHADHEPTGLWLRENAGNDALIGVFDAGMVPFLAERRTLDLGGLNERTIATLLKQKRSAEAAEYVLDRKPTFLVLAPFPLYAGLSPFPVDAALSTNPRFREDYRLLFVSGRPDVIGEYHLFVFRRNGPPADAAQEPARRRSVAGDAPAPR